MAERDIFAPNDLMLQAVPAQRFVARSSGPSWTSREDSFRNKVADWLAGVGKPEGRQDRYFEFQRLMGGGPRGKTLGDKVAQFLDPREGLSRAADEAQAGEYGSAAVDAAGSIPGLGKVLLGAGKAGKAVPFFKGMLIGAAGMTPTELKAMEEARRLAKQGVSAEDIWKQHRMADIGRDRWVTEIPPGEYSPPAPGGSPMKDVYRSEELYKRLPLADMRVESMRSPRPGEHGAYYHRDPRITINTSDPLDVQYGSIVHEGTHAASHVSPELPPGSSPDIPMVYPSGPGWDNFIAELKRVHSSPPDTIEELAKGSGLDINDPKVKAGYKNYLAVLKSFQKQDFKKLSNPAWIAANWEHPLIKEVENKANFRTYQMDTGEALARESAKRDAPDWTPEMRNTIPPGDPRSTDVLPAQRIDTNPNKTPWPGVTNPFPSRSP